jgi:HSP20 family protein
MDPHPVDSLIPVNFALADVAHIRRAPEAHPTPPPRSQPMNLPTRWNPFRQINRFDPLVDFEDLFRGMALRPLSRQDEAAMEMRMDIREDDKAYLISVDMPGVKKEDVDVSVDGNQVSITAEVTREQSSDNEKQLYSERYSGKAFRSFSLPTEVDTSKSEARYDGGVLKLTLPKKATAGSRHLSIN